MTAHHGRDATRVARARFHSRANDWRGLCLRNVRECLDIPSRYMSAKEAWDNNGHRVPFHGEDHERIPFGAPVWSRSRSHTDLYGHIFLAGGRFRKGGERLFWTTDQFGDGRVTPVPLSFFTQHWNHEILGWARSLNGVYIPYLSPNV